MKNIIVLFLLIFNLNIFSQEQPTIVIQKTSCYGKCPVYEMKIFKSGKIILKGEKNMDKIGNYVTKISKKELKSLIRNFDQIDFFNINDEYTARITDLPTTYLSFNNKNQSKTIKDYHGAPKELKDLEKRIENYLQLSSWKKNE